MESSDCHTTPKLSFSLRQLSRLNRLTNLLLMASIITLSCSIVLQVNPIVAQEIAQSPSLDKNNNTIYVDPQDGDDDQLGKKTSPLQTITQALKVATAGSTIQLASGTYSAKTGEKFPLVIDNQIILQGDPQNQGYKTIIQGDGYFISPTGAGQNVAIAALKDAGGITGITVTNNHSRGHGIWVESASLQIVSNTLTRNGSTGVSINGQSSPLIENNYFYNNLGNGLLVYGDSQPKVIKNTFEETGFGISLVQHAAAKINENIFDGNRIGIILEGSSQGTLRHNKIINSGEAGLMAIAQSRIDLGTDNEPGNNVFRSNRKLDIQNATSNEIVAVGTEVQGETQGDINFERGTFVASNGNRNNPLQDSAKDLAPLPSLPSRDDAVQPETQSKLAPLPPLPPRGDLAQPEASSTIEPAPADLPPPPPVIASSIGENNTGNNNKELVFRSSLDSPDSEPENSNVLPVPSPPTISTSSSAAQVKYKVLVEVLDDDEADEVRSLYPEAFETILGGESWLQVGAFSNRDKAQQAEQHLVELGLATYLLE
jgi:parallel beta-helix repeat protein